MPSERLAIFVPDSSAGEMKSQCLFEDLEPVGHPDGSSIYFRLKSDDDASVGWARIIGFDGLAFKAAILKDSTERLRWLASAVANCEGRSLAIAADVNEDSGDGFEECSDDEQEDHIRCIDGTDGDDQGGEALDDDGSHDE